MRWSLILSTFIVVLSALSFACVALVIPSSVELERRGSSKRQQVSESPKVYRKNSLRHKNAYHEGPDGVLKKSKLKLIKDRFVHGMKKLKLQKTQGDHVYEIQMVNTHLKTMGYTWEQLHPNLQKDIRGIINGPDNVALIPGRINGGKGQVIKNALRGLFIKPKPDRDQYIKDSYSTAKKSAERLDKAFDTHNTHLRGTSFKDPLRAAAETAGIFNPGEHSPATSRSSSPPSKSSAGGSKNSSSSSLWGKLTRVAKRIGKK